jgi:uncharacterized Zn-finger protein
MTDEEFYLVNDREVVITPHMHVRCNGGNGLLGHPVEYMTLENGQVICKYCGRRYVLAGDPEAGEIRARGVARAA